MKKIGYALVGFAFMFVAACGTGNGTCESNSDCNGAEQCLWMKRNAQVIGKRCVQKCATDGECGGPLCSATAVSCAACNDNIRVCEAN